MDKLKNTEFTVEEEQVARFAKALSHPARVRILKILAETNSCVCGGIVDLLPLAQSTVSQHLKELKNAKLIDGEIDGPKICYCLNTKNFLKAKQLFIKQLNSIKKED